VKALTICCANDGAERMGMEITLFNQVIDLFVVLLWTIVCLAAYIINSWLLGRVFHKAKVAKWMAWIPLVRDWKFLNLGGHSGFCIFLAIISSALAAAGGGIISTFIEGQSVISAIVGVLLLVAAFAVFAFYIYALVSSYYNIQKKLDKPAVFLVLALINLIAPVWLWILALDRSKWNDKKGRPMVK
jgi:hypothetical protein